MTTDTTRYRRTTGLAVKVSRARLGLTQAQLGELMGCSRQRVTQLEQMAVVPEVWAEKWKAAVARKPAG